MKNFWKILTALFIVLFVLAIFLFFWLKDGEETEVLFPESKVSYVVETAVSPLAQARGLMERADLPFNRGMLFVFPDSEIRFFWMKNTLLPLDIIFISAEGKIVDMKKNFLPCQKDPCEAYASAWPAKYVLEINAGQAEEKKLMLGGRAAIKGLSPNAVFAIIFKIW